MIRKDVGVVLKAGRSGETSKHFTFFGRESGKVKLLAKGALNTRSRYRAVLETGNFIEAVYYYKDERTLYFVKEASLIWAPARDSLERMAVVLAVVDLIDQVCYWSSPERGVLEAYEAVVGSDDDPLFAFLAFQLRLLDVFGTRPDFFSCRSCGKRLRGGFFHPLEGVAYCSEHSFDAPHRMVMDGELLGAIEALGSAAPPTLHDVDDDTRKRLGKLLHWTYTSHVQGYSLPEALKLIPKKS